MRRPRRTVLFGRPEVRQHGFDQRKGRVDDAVRLGGAAALHAQRDLGAAQDDLLGAACQQPVGGHVELVLRRGDPVALDVGDARRDQVVEVLGGRRDHLEAHALQRCAVNAHPVRALGREHAHPSGGGVVALHLLRAGLDDVQHRRAAGACHVLVPAVRAVAGDGDDGAARRVEEFDAGQQLRQGRGALAQDAGGTVGRGAVAVQDRAGCAPGRSSRRWRP